MKIIDNKRGGEYDYYHTVIIVFKKIYIEITNICNMKCKFCPDTNRKKQYMDIKQFEKIVKKICNYTNLICLHVKGEPLLHGRIEDILAILEKYNLKTNITTNGTLLEKNLEILKNSNSIRQINISIHSFSENQINNRLNYIDIKSYFTGIFNSVDKLENKIISYRLWNNKSIVQNDKNNEIIQQLEEYYKIGDLKKKLSKNEFIKIKENLYINQDLQFEWPDINKHSILENGRCLALKDQIAILVDGTVVPCCLDNNGNIPLGNIYNQDLEDILNSLKSIQIKKGFENGLIVDDLCKTCGFLKNLENKRKNN